MESPSEVKWLGIKPYIVRVFSGFMALWSANQVVYFVLAATASFPDTTTDSLFLVFPSEQLSYLAPIIWHVIGVAVFGIVAAIPGHTLMRVEEWWEVHRERPTWIAGVAVYVGFALLVLVYYWLGITDPKYQTYIDPDAASVVQRHTNVLRPGVTHKSIAFGEIQEIVFELAVFLGDDESNLYLVLQDGREVEVGRATLDYTLEDLVDLGKAISQHSGVPFEEPDLPEVR